MSRLLSARSVKILAAGYLLKALVVAALWLAAPEIPARALARLRATWTEITGPAAAR